MSYQIAQPQTGAAVSVDLHPGNRFRMMFGLSLLPENGQIPNVPEYKPEPQCPAPTAKK